ncbi:YciI family protein [Erysipelotrichaceae bacterium OttesenSCG-928-M19]|nr:YciI family protein [Erysipelotrichaceae bacterium OttesenSCG-928-M19]
MKYYVLEGINIEHNYKQEEYAKIVKAHQEYLQKGFEDGTILVAGPKSGGGGGIIILKSNEILKFCNKDPFINLGVQEYRISQFDLFQCQKELEKWFK